MNARRRVVPILFVLVAAGCAAGAPNAAANNDADTKAIDALRDRELALLTSGMQPDSVRAVYTDDVDFLPPGEAAVQGVDNVTKWGADMVAAANVSGKYLSSHVTVSGDMAVDRYTATLTATPKAGGPATEEAIKGLHVLKRQPGGGWKIAIDVWNPDKAEAPPPAPTAAPKKK
jgi:ketosteroid isomerase-like protein